MKCEYCSVMGRELRYDEEGGTWFLRCYACGDTEGVTGREVGLIFNESHDEGWRADYGSSCSSSSSCAPKRYRPRFAVELMEF